MKQNYIIYNTKIVNSTLSLLVFGIFVFSISNNIRDFSYMGVILSFAILIALISLISKRQLIYLDYLEHKIVIKNGIKPLYEEHIIPPSEIKAIILAYDTLDRKRYRVIKPYFLDILNNDFLTYTVFRSNKYDKIYEKAETLSTVLKKPIEDYTDTENKKFHKERKYIV
ncbi:MAG: hypothetical protein KAR21_11675 [Spirochaetales bacterium]|nr:hypothetical protein [Spirochaetales bacterium]